MIQLNSIREHVISMLSEGLSKALTYHNTHHTLDVTEQALAIAKEEGVTDAEILLEFEIASLYHDTGFLYTYNGHEAKGCEIAKAQLPLFGVSKKSILHICELIMATKVPQTPLNHLQQIICDADLDYLGRKDFFKTSNFLRLELIAYHFIKDDHDWEKRQLEFLKAHRYFTKTSMLKRGPAKMEIIEQVEKNLEISTKK